MELTSTVSAHKDLKKIGTISGKAVLDIDMEFLEGAVKIQYGTTEQKEKIINAHAGDHVHFVHSFLLDTMTECFFGFYPLRIEHKGVQYILQETKNGKLLLTK